MKKTFVSAMICLLVTSVFATETARVTVTLSSANSKKSELTIVEGSEYLDAYESGVDVENLMYIGTSRSTLIYGDVAGTYCEQVFSASLEGLKIGFTTSRQADTQYTLSFSNFSGRELKLYDAVEDKVITINASTEDYKFDVTAEQLNNTKVLDRFVIGEPASIPYEICHRYGKLQISGYDGAVVVKSGDEEKINVTVNSGRKQKEVDLNLDPGYYTVEANGQSLIIKVE